VISIITFVLILSKLFILKVRSSYIFSLANQNKLLAILTIVKLLTSSLLVIQTQTKPKPSNSQTKPKPKPNAEQSNNNQTRPY